VLGRSGSETGTADGAAVGAELSASGFGFRTAFFTAGFFTAGLAFFFGAALTAFFATFFATFFTDFALTLFLAFALTFVGLFFTFPALFLAFAAGRFLDLLFFAMINLLLEIVRTRCESSPEKVCCHLCMMLESFTWIA
jgi:hypothetical protein